MASAGHGVEESAWSKSSSAVISGAASEAASASVVVRFQVVTAVAKAAAVVCTGAMSLR